MSAAAPIPVVTLEAVDSTNSEAMRRIAAGLRTPVWITAARQTAGKGRSGRGWTSDAGNLYASLVWPVAAAPAIAYHLALLAGVATVDAIGALAGSTGTVPGLRLKWPNDVLVGGAKLAGILCESTSPSGPTSFIAVLGIGINVAAAPAGTGRPTVSLSDMGIAATPALVLDQLNAWMSRRLAVWSDGTGFDQVRALWLERAGPIGEPLRINVGDTAVEGRFAGLDPSGALLIVLADGETRTFTYGDVTLPATSAPARRV